MNLESKYQLISILTNTKVRTILQDILQNGHVKPGKRAVSRHIGRVPGPSQVTKQEACWLDKAKVSTNTTSLCSRQEPTRKSLICVQNFKKIIAFLVSWQLYTLSHGS